MSRLLLYCCKTKPYLIHESGCYDSEDMCCDYDCFSVVDRQELYNQDISLDETYNGKIVAECDYEVEEIFEDNLEDARDGYLEHFYTLKSYDDFDEGQKALLKESCLQKHELSNYLGFENGYAIHIKNLHIFDRPKELSEFTTFTDFGKPITKAPQNMCNVCDDLEHNCERYILISSRPEWLCKILNGEKTIEIRKKVLKEMLNNE